MLTANEMRTRQNKNTMDEQRTAELLETTKKRAIIFANTVLNEDLTNKSHEHGRSITWLFKTNDYQNGYYINNIPRNKRAEPVKETVVATKAHRFYPVYFGDKGEGRYGVDLNALKDYLEQHGYRVTIKEHLLEEDSWSRKSSYLYQGFKMVISWEE